MTDLEAHLTDLAPHHSIAKVVRAAARARASLQSARRADYVSLQPSSGFIVCYVHANRLSIAMDPTEAVDASRALPGSRLERRNQSTTYVVVPAATVSEHHDDVLKVVTRSIDWRAAG